MRNNADNKEIKAKKSVVLTPSFVANYIYQNLKRFPFKNVLDVGCWDGSLSKSWTKKHNSNIIGLDITEEFKGNFDTFIFKDFLEATKEDFKGLNIDLILCNPPFGKHKEKGDLYPNLFIKKIFEIFGNNIPVVLIVGHWFLSNSNNRISYLNGANITKNTTLHKRTFSACGVDVESNILYFNIKQKVANDFLEFQKPTPVKQRFKTVAFNSKQIEYLKQIPNFSGTVKELLKKEFPNFPI